MGTTPQDRATIDGITGEIATQLGETDEEPIRQIRRAVRILGAHQGRTVGAGAPGRGGRRDAAR